MLLAGFAVDAIHIMSCWKLADHPMFATSVARKSFFEFQNCLTEANND